jgi:hypothetical protein
MGGSSGKMGEGANVEGAYAISAGNAKAIN